MCAFDECVLQDNDLRMSAASGGGGAVRQERRRAGSKREKERLRKRSKPASLDCHPKKTAVVGVGDDDDDMLLKNSSCGSKREMMNDGAGARTHTRRELPWRMNE